MNKMKFSPETEKLITKEQRVQVPILLETFKHFPRARVCEGVKYVLHLNFEGDCTQDVHKQFESNNYFTGKVMGKSTTIFFFLPLFE